MNNQENIEVISLAESALYSVNIAQSELKKASFLGYWDILKKKDSFFVNYLKYKNISSAEAIIKDAQLKINRLNDKLRYVANDLNINKNFLLVFLDFENNLFSELIMQRRIKQLQNKLDELERNLKVLIKELKE